MVAATQALIEETPDADWLKIWPIIDGNRALGMRVIESASHGEFGEERFIAKLTESQLGKLYLWMVRAYPYAEHRVLGARAMGPADMAVMLRDGILEHLKRRASFAACDALRDVIEDLSQYSGLRHQLEEAESLARAATWQPISAREFLTLVFDHNKHLIENGEQLVEVVLESLDRLNSKLHGELSPVKYLWVPSNSGFRARDEEDVSDYIAGHLDEDLRQRALIVNREVQIRRGVGRGSGQTTDIHVDAVVPGAKSGAYERIYVIVEVKGSWHNELLSAMRTQLRDRYLKDNRCRNGIYLVGWFTSPSWDSGDYRKNKHPSMTLDEAQQLFAKQAVDLSTEGYIIKSSVMDLVLA